MSWERPFEGKLINTWIWPVQSNFLHFFGVPIVEGRDFLESDSTGQHGMIFNQKVLKQYTLKNVIGKDITGFNTKYSIVGVAKNINYASLKDSIKPMAFVIMDNTWMKWFFIRISGKDTPATIESIKHTWKKYCDEDFDLKFLDTTLNELYKKESNLAKLISIFGLVIIVIAVMGVYGLIVFNARYKSKEIAIRKINGASVKEIILMLNRSILIQLVIAFVVAVPLAYYVVHRWLEQFPYKTPISWWVFALAGLLIFIITVVTVSLHSYKAAATNPVDAVKGE
jgi:Predicted permease.